MRLLTTLLFLLSMGYLCGCVCIAYKLLEYQDTLRYGALDGGNVELRDFYRYSVAVRNGVFGGGFLAAILALVFLLCHLGVENFGKGKN